MNQKFEVKQLGDYMVPWYSYRKMGPISRMKEEGQARLGAQSSPIPSKIRMAQRPGSYPPCLQRRAPGQDVARPKVSPKITEMVEHFGMRAVKVHGSRILGGERQQSEDIVK